MENVTSFFDIGKETIRGLETDRGILASGRAEIYGCIFGRDSLITSMKLLSAYEKGGDEYFLHLTRKTLVNLAALQGADFNIESGEEPGKMIHEYRTENHTHLTSNETSPWYLYPDNVMKNYDSVDSTLLFLMATNRYYRLSNDEEFYAFILPFVQKAFRWVSECADTNRDGFIDYQMHPDRAHGGLRVQNWMDSQESLFHEDGSEVQYPVAPVEVQAYAYAACRAWADTWKDSDPDLALTLREKASELKSLFNKKFVIGGNGNDSQFAVASGIDGDGRPILSARSSVGHVLWAVWKDNDQNPKSILEEKYVPLLVERLLKPDLFEPNAGLRTLSTESVNFSANSYHNGSIWPHDTSMIAEGLENFGYSEEALRVRRALFAAFAHFKTPLELFVYENGEYREYLSHSGQRACREQAWSAAAMLSDALAPDDDTVAQTEVTESAVG